MATPINTNFIKESYKNLPPVMRGVVTVGGIALGAYIVYRVYKSLSGTISGEVTQQGAGKQESGSWNSELEQYNQSTSTKPTISPAQAKSMAQSLFIAMDGYTTDEWGIVAIFNKLRNNADFASLQSAYGVREISSGKFNPAPNYKGTLTGALASELSQYWRDKINKILQGRSIKYRV